MVNCCPFEVRNFEANCFNILRSSDVYDTKLHNLLNAFLNASRSCDFNSDVIAMISDVFNDAFNLLRELG